MATNSLSADDVCSICLCPLQNQVARQEIVQTPCQHIFHQACLTDWIINGDPGGCCPLCKKEMRVCDAIPVRIENVALADTTAENSSTTRNANGDIHNGEAVVVPLRRSQRLRGRQITSNLSDINETPTTVSSGMPQSDQQIMSLNIGQNLQIHTQGLQQELERQTQQVQEQLPLQTQQIQERLQMARQVLQRLQPRR